MKNIKSYIKSAIISVVLAVVLFLSASSFTNTAKAESDPYYGPGTYTEKVYKDGHWYVIVYNDNYEPIIVVVDPTW